MKKLALLITILPLLGCLHKADVKEQVQDGAAMAACISSHWGEDWTVLMANCSGPGLELFYDIVADIVAATEKDGKTVATQEATPAPAASSPTVKLTAMASPKTLLPSQQYAKQPEIAKRLTLKKPALQERQ